MCKKMICLMTFVLLLGLASVVQATTYYVSPSGNDNNSGTSTSQAWKTTTKVNSRTFSPGDSILFEGGQTFTGGLVFTAGGTPAAPITLSSYGSGRATIQGNLKQTVLLVDNCAGFNITNMIFRGSGNTWQMADQPNFHGIRFFAHAGSGVKLQYIRIDNVEVCDVTNRGIFFDGLDFSGFNDVRVTNSVVHNIGTEGINSSTNWPVSQDSHTNFYIGDCVVYDVTGIHDASAHTGSGIVFGGLNGAVIEFCEAYNGGQLNAAGGGGPIGIWVWESSNVTFQFNESHHNKTFGGDGGGLDLDGGSSFCNMQYNYTHDNQGASALIMQFARSRYAGNHIFRYNIGANDGTGSWEGKPMGLITFYTDSSGSPSNVDVYNNTMYNGPDSRAGCVTIWVWTGNYSNINLRNNLFITEPGKPVFTTWTDTEGIYFQGNCYWARGGPLRFILDSDGASTVYTGLNWWHTYGQEMLSGSPVGYEMDPKLADVSAHPTLHPHNLGNLTGYKLASNSPAIDRGLNLQTLFGINPGTRDYYAVSIPQGSVYDIGANEELGGGQVPIPPAPPADTTAPAPNPMTFATAPHSTSSSSIAMTATTASDTSGVQYYFTCTAGGGHNSGWQYITSYTDTGLTPNKLYTYTVKARDISTNLNETAASSAQSATTAAYAGNIIWSDGFESGNFTAGGWVAGGSVIKVTTGAKYTGNYGAHLGKGGWIYKTISTVGYTNIRIRYMRNTLSSASCVIRWWDGSNAHLIETSLGSPWTQMDIVCGPEADNNPNFQIYYRELGGHPKAQYTYVDDVQIWGVGGAPDTTPPTPNPMTWATVPYATGSTSIAMVATTASDPSGVEYFFDETSGNPGGSDSAWQDSTSYTDTGLQPGTQYTYRMQARDKSVNQNATGWSTSQSATTTQPDTTPPSPNPMTWSVLPYATGSTSIAMVATTATDPSGVEYFFDETSGNPGGSDSAWQDSTSYTDTGLSPGTMYTYRMQARDKSPNQNATGWSTSQSATTQTGGDTTPPSPNPMTWATVPYATGSTSIAMVATTATDASGVEYYFDETSGNPGGSDSAWQDSTSYTDTGLSPSTQYTYRVQARDKSVNQNATGWSTSQSATTQSGGGPQLFYDNFNDGDMAGWTISGSAGPSTENIYEGAYSCKLKQTASMEVSISTVGYTSIHFKYARTTNGNLDAGEYLTASWYDGTNWNTVEQVGNAQPWALKDWALSAGAANNANFKIRFSINASQNTEFGFVDVVEITGQ